MFVRTHICMHIYIYKYPWTPKPWENEGFSFKPSKYGLYPLKMKVMGSHGIYIYKYLLYKKRAREKPGSHQPMKFGPVFSASQKLRRRKSCTEFCGERGAECVTWWINVFSTFSQTLNVWYIIQCMVYRCIIVYLHLPTNSTTCIGKYSSPMEHLWVLFDEFWIGKTRYRESVYIGTFALRRR